MAKGTTRLESAPSDLRRSTERAWSSLALGDYHGLNVYRILADDASAREQVMALPGVDESNPLQGLPLDELRRAAVIYLAVAYPNSEPPPAVRRRLEWTPGLHAGELLIKPPFERVGKTPNEKLIFALRLGNARYPHMKMQIQPWDARLGFLLSVNTHDHALTLDPSEPDVEAFLALQAENQRLKVVIEQAWDEAGLPTFPRYLKDYLAGQGGAGGSGLLA